MALHTASKPASLKAKLQALRSALLQGLIERETPVSLALLAALAGEHLLLIGPPGTAKSEVARRLRSAFRDASYFERLLTRFSVPEELFGPLSIKALEEDRYLRKTDGYLPCASVAFLDEVFKANSAILNSLLTLLNEREFDNGSSRIKTPLISIVAASNELPEGDDLSALYDRFLLRFYTPPVSQEGFLQLLSLPETRSFAPDLFLRLSHEEIQQIQKEAALVRLSPPIKTLLHEMRAWLQEQKIAVSDRRWRKIVFLLKISAYTDGRDEVSLWDAWLLQHCTWETPEQRDSIFLWYQSKLGISERIEPLRLHRLAATWETTLQKEREPLHLRDKQDRLLYLDENGNGTISTTRKVQKKNSNGEPLYLSHRNDRDRTNGGQGYTESTLRLHFNLDTSWWKDPQNWLVTNEPSPPKTAPKTFSQGHIEGRTEEMKKWVSELKSHEEKLQASLEKLHEEVEEHLWITKGFAEPARASLTEQLETLGKIRERFEVLQKGFAELPLESEAGS